MEISLVILYSGMFAWIIYRWRGFHIKTIPKAYLVLLYLLKVAVGILYIVLHEQHISGGDIFHYLDDSQVMFATWSDNKRHFLQLLFGPNGGDIPPHLEVPITTMGFWDNTSAYFMVRVHCLIRFFSFGHLWVHAVFMAFLSFGGLTALGHVLQDGLSVNRKLAIYGLFLFPSILFWTSGLHKESVLTLGLGWYVYGAYQLSKGRFHWKYLALTLAGAVLLFLVRDFILYLSVPAFLGYYLCRHTNLYPLAGYGGMYLLTLLLASFLLQGTEYDFLQLIDAKRSDFLSLKIGNTSIELQSYEPTLVSFLSGLPNALINSLFRPYPWEADHLFQWMAALESIAFFLMTVLSVLRRKWRGGDGPLLFYLLFYGLSLLAIVGMIVPNIGAILRYRVVGLLLLVPAFAYLGLGNRKAG